MTRTTKAEMGRVGIDREDELSLIFCWQGRLMMRVIWNSYKYLKPSDKSPLSRDVKESTGMFRGGHEDQEKKFEMKDDLIVNWR